MKIEKISVYAKERETRDGRRFLSTFTYIDKTPYSIKFTRMSGRPSDFPATIRNVECKFETDNTFKSIIIFSYEANHERR